MNSGKGRLIIISAPSGAGKDTIINRIMKLRPELALSVSATTRAPRIGEAEGVSYYFVTRERFCEMIEKGEFLEYANYVGEFYGTPMNPIKKHIDNGRDVLLEIEVQGARQVMTLAPDAITIFIVPPDMDELERRLRGRGTDSEEKLAARLERAKLELEDKTYYSHVIVNDDVNQAVEAILSIINQVP